MSAPTTAQEPELGVEHLIARGYTEIGILVSQRLSTMREQYCTTIIRRCTQRGFHDPAWLGYPVSPHDRGEPGRRCAIY